MSKLRKKSPKVVVIVVTTAKISRNRLTRGKSLAKACMYRKSRSVIAQRVVYRCGIGRKKQKKDKSPYSDLEIILTYDLNRWDTLWGGNQVASHSR